MAADESPVCGGRVDEWPFRLFWAGQSVSALGDGLAMLAIPLLVLSLTHNPIFAALAATPRTVGFLIAGLYAGAVVDRRDCRRVMIVMDTLRLAVFAAVALLAAARLLNVGELLAAAFIAAIGTVFFSTAYAVLVRDLLAADQMLRGNARLELSTQVGTLTGPVVTGLLAATVGLPAVIWFNAASFAVSIATLLPLRRVVAAPAAPDSPATPNVAQPSFATSIKEGLAFVWRTPALRGLAGLQAAINFLVGAETLLVFYATVTLRASATVVGLVVTAGGLGGVLGALASEKIRIASARAAIGAAVAAIAVGLLGIGATPSIPVVAGFTLVLGAAGVFGTVHIRAVRQRIVPRAMLGRVTSSAGMLALMGGPVGAALSGTIAGALGNPRPVLVAAGTLALGCAVLGYARWLVGVDRDQTPVADDLPDVIDAVS